jgi:hypothetical protein
MTNTELAERLQELKTHMLALCWDLSKHSDEGRQHAKELSNAASMVGDWAEAIEKKAGL